MGHDDYEVRLKEKGAWFNWSVLAGVLSTFTVVVIAAFGLGGKIDHVVFKIETQDEAIRRYNEECQKRFEQLHAEQEKINEKINGHGIRIQRLEDQQKPVSSYPYDPNRP